MGNSYEHSPCPRYVRRRARHDPDADRSQVRKNAELQKNPLGPQWSTWVGRAVTKLVSIDDINRQVVPVH